MVDPIRVRRLLQALTRALATLERESKASDERRSDPMWLAGVEFTFVNAIEACIDIAQHLSSSEGWGPPHSNAESMRMLARHGILATDVAEEMAAAVGFRNVLVHQYADVDHSVTIARLGDHDVLHHFASAVAHFVPAG
ncbi:DUF86 domain-containing protein [Geodermatophilus sp. DF01-2]|uniref:type VII toxin-antitoxin system HepT family RNase toxin n=1 Tax=Geodermatophilus sp. DF01-2 TaxID=2559610 RepID=UPI001430757B|nr:DUF86 domain-containing protein [Geodermatophilus sp. DF01_2]